MKINWALALVFLINIRFYAQNLTISGLVIDFSSKNPLEKAVVILKSTGGDKSTGMTTDKNGRFVFNFLTAGNYNLKITYIGYKDYNKDINLTQNLLDLKSIPLHHIPVTLHEIEIKGEPVPVTLKQDTTEYSAGSFKTNKDATAEDLVNKMPGITTQNGQVQAQGESVSKVLVDGKEFFGNDPNAVLRNLPAQIIDKIQVFDQQSDQSQFTGFDDGNTTKTINIVTRMRNRQGTFGKLTGGYGDAGKYVSGGNTNFFNKDQRLTLLGQLNNINQQNFSSEDLLGVMSGGGRVFRGGMGGGGRRSGYGGGYNGSGSNALLGGPGGFGTPNVSNFLVSQSTGLVDTKAAGINYSDKWGEKIEFQGSYFFNLTNNNAIAVTDRNYFLTSQESQLYDENNTSLTKNTNNHFNARMNYQVDSSNSILITPSLTLQLNNASSNVLGNTMSGNNSLNSTNNIFYSNLNAYNSPDGILVRHKFGKQGRTISLMLNGSFTGNTGNNSLDAEDIYYGTTNTSQSTNQQADISQHGYIGSSNLVYTEPLFDNSLMQFNAGYSYSENNSNQNTFDLLNNINQLDTSLSNVYREIYKIQSIGTGYRFKQEKLIMALNLNYNVSILNNSRTFPIDGYLEKKFYSFLPSMMLRYNISMESNLRIMIRSNNDAPSIIQLQDVLNNSNPTQLSMGNPNLSQDSKNSVVLKYSQISPGHTNIFFILFSGTFTKNYIANNTIVANNDTTVLNNIALNRGSRITLPVNLDGYINLHSFITYGLPVASLKSNINFSLSVSYSHTPALLNSIANYTNSTQLGGGIVFSSNISEDLDYTLSSNSDYTFSKNNLDATNNTNYFTQRTDLKFYLNVLAGFVLQNELNDQFNNNVPNSFDKNILLWTLSLGKKFLGGDNGELRFTATDLLNQNTNIQHNVTDTYTEDVKTNVLGKYFMLSFIYNIRKFE
jgi:Outer membrane protein beta-barrel family/Carboxypeptidase regulatory-like domain